MSKEIQSISPIAIDLGAKFTGVFLSNFSPGEDPSQATKSGLLIHIPEKSKQWSQQPRRMKRHQRRGSGPKSQLSKGRAFLVNAYLI